MMVRRMNVFLFWGLVSVALCAAQGSVEGHIGVHSVEEKGGKVRTKSRDSGYCGDNLHWSFDREKSSLTITGTGGMPCEVNSEYPWHQCRNITKSVTIETGVTIIENHAFASFTHLTSVRIPETVTKIDNLAFYCCSSLESISIPSNVTYFGNYAFSSSGLTSVTIPSSVNSTGFCVFQHCSHLKSVAIPSDSSLTSIENETFDGCYNLSSIVIPSSVKTIGESAFQSCKKLSSITIPSGVESIGESAFSSCSNLEQAIFAPNSSLISIGSNSFSSCQSLSSITIPGSVTSIGRSAFADCTSLASLAYNGSSDPSNGEAFVGCNKLKFICVSSNYTSEAFSSFQFCKSSDCEMLVGNRCFDTVCSEIESNECYEYQCPHHGSPVYLRQCSDGDETGRACDNQCIVSKSETTKGVVAEVLVDDLYLMDITLEDITRTISSLINVDVELAVRTGIDDKGHVVCIFITVDNEEIADAIVDAVNKCSQQNGGNSHI